MHCTASLGFLDLHATLCRLSLCCRIPSNRVQIPATGLAPTWEEDKTAPQLADVDLAACWGQGVLKAVPANQLRAVGNRHVEREWYQAVWARPEQQGRMSMEVTSLAQHTQACDTLLLLPSQAGEG